MIDLNRHRDGASSLDFSCSCSSRLRKAYVAANPSVFSSHLARARQRAATAAACSCSGSYQAQPIQSLDGGHNREKDCNSQNEESKEGEEMSHEAHLRKTGGRQSRRNEADTQTRSS